MSLEVATFGIDTNVLYAVQLTTQIKSDKPSGEVMPPRERSSAMGRLHALAFCSNWFATALSGHACSVLAARPRVAPD
jgi:hypothetical protein